MSDSNIGRNGVSKSPNSWDLIVVGAGTTGLPAATFAAQRGGRVLLVEAAEREEVALRNLHNAWRPFTADVFKAVDQERLNADRLRRQADIALQELRDRS